MTQLRAAMEHSGQMEQQQINTSLTNLEARMNQLISAMKQQQNATVVLQKEVAASGRHAAAAAKAASSAASAATAAASAAPPVSKEASQWKAIEGLLQEEKYEQAFTMALSQQKLDMVMKLCDISEKTDVFAASSAHHLSNAVSLSLVQQLAFELNKATMLKLAWLKEALVALDPRDAVVKEHVRPVLQEVLGRLGDYAKHNGLDIENPSNLIS